MSIIDNASRACSYLWTTEQMTHLCGLDVEHEGHHICGAGAPWGACAEYDPDTSTSRVNTDGEWSDWADADGRMMEG